MKVPNMARSSQSPILGTSDYLHTFQPPPWHTFPVSPGYGTPSTTMMTDYEQMSDLQCQIYALESELEWTKQVLRVTQSTALSLSKSLENITCQSSRISRSSGTHDLLNDIIEVFDISQYSTLEPSSCDAPRRSPVASTTPESISSTAATEIKEHKYVHYFPCRSEKNDETQGPAVTKATDTSKLAIHRYIKHLPTDHLFSFENSGAVVQTDLGPTLDSHHTTHTKGLLASRYAIEKEPIVTQVDEAVLSIRMCDGPRSTVMISGLPLDTKIDTISKIVRGGLLISARLLDTATITNSKHIMVTFMSEQAAHDYVKFVKAHDIFEAPTSVSLLDTPTWPVRSSPGAHIIQKDVTRCIQIANFPISIDREWIERDVSSDALNYSTIEGMELDTKGVLQLRFMGIHHAERAFVTLRSKSRYRGLKVEFTSDPCDAPLEELLLVKANKSRNDEKGSEQSQEKTMGDDIGDLIDLNDP